MVDTLQLTLARFDVEPGHGLTIQPGAFVPRTGEILGNYRLWAGQEGRSAFLNTTDFNFDVKPRRGVVRAAVHLSLPGYGHADNVSGLNRGEVGAVFDDVQRRLSDAGVDCDLREARVSRLDAFTNVQTSEPFGTYVPVLGLLQGRRMRDFVQYGGTAFRWGNTVSQINAYDKLAEMEHRRKSVARFEGSNLVRFEHRSLTGRKVRDLYGFKTAADFETGYDSIGEVYRRQMTENLFRYDGTEIEVMSGRQIQEELRLFREVGGRYWLTEFLMAHGMKALLKMVSVETVAAAVAEVSGNTMAATRSRRKLERALVRQKLLTRSPVVVKTLQTLYDELRDGVLRRAA